DGRVYCDDCGFMFPPEAPEGAPASAKVAPGVKMRVKSRYEFGEAYAERLGVTRHKGVDLGIDGGNSRPMIVVRRPAAAEAESGPATDVVAELVEADADVEIMPGFVTAVPAALPVTEPLPAKPEWPSPAWEEKLLGEAHHPTLPGVLDSFAADG